MSEILPLALRRERGPEACQHSELRRGSRLYGHSPRLSVVSPDRLRCPHVRKRIGCRLPADRCVSTCDAAMGEDVADPSKAEKLFKVFCVPKLKCGGPDFLGLA